MKEREELELILNLMRKYNLPLSPILEYAIKEKIEEYPEPSENHKDIKAVDEKPLTQQTESVNQVDGIWDAFKSVQFRKKYETYLVNNGMNRYEASKRMNYFFLKVKDADNAGVYRKKIRECSSFKECTEIIKELFDTWGNRLKFKWVQELFLDYVDFLKDIYQEHGTLDDSKEDNLKKIAKIEFTFQDGHKELMNPLDALRKAVSIIGPENVSKMNLKVVNDKLIQHYEPAGNRYYENIGEGWWLNTKGTPKSKYQCIRIMFSRVNTSIIIKLL